VSTGLANRTRAADNQAVVTVRSAVGVLVALLLLPACADAAKGKKQKPDLVPTGARLVGPSFGLIGERPTSEVEDSTENKGEKRAGPSLTRITLRHGSIRHDVGDRAVPGIRAGGRDGGRSAITDIDILDPGEYKVIVCVDAKKDVDESNEKNNCGRVDADFYVSRESWTGSLSGVFPQSGDVLEGWSSTDAGLVFDQYLGGGTFTYNFQGTVTWRTGGTDAGGCSWSGGGSHTFAPSSENGGLTLDLAAGQYRAGISAPPSFTYDVTVACPSGTGQQKGPVSPIFFSTAGGTKAFPFGTSSITGNASEPLTGTNYVWNLS
jgi:hypothetical protein